MEEIVYLSVRIGCAGYLLYKLWNQKKRIRKICGLLYPPGKKEKEEEGTSCGTGPGDVMGLPDLSIWTKTRVRLPPPT